MTATLPSPASTRRPYGVRAEDGLTWYPERALGYYPVSARPSAVYDQGYFAQYQAYAATEMGRQITHARLALLDRHLPQEAVLDVGIGAGAFLEARGRSAPTFGFDINPVGVSWLMERDLFRDPLAGPIAGMTFWDSLEHIADPEPILANATWVFASLPIFTGPEHVLRSKHFKRDEHCWYFTREGLIGWMDALGFRCVEHNTSESLLGREDIGTFAFRREEPKPDVLSWGAPR